MEAGTSRSIFTLDHARLGGLTSVPATALFRDLLWCEAHRVGLSPHRVRISLNTTVADGGIDAVVRGNPAFDSVLVGGDCHFQVKTGTAFKPWVASSIHKELFGKAANSATRKHLAQAVAECCAGGGCYTVVTFGYDLTAPQAQTAEALLRKALARCGFKNARVAVLGQTQLTGLISAFPSLVYRLQGLEDQFFYDFGTWRDQALMTPALQTGDAQNALIRSIREQLNGSAIQHIRVIGEPGIGKTRLVLEAVSTPEWSPLVLYAPVGEEFQRSRLLLDLLRNSGRLRAVIVVDDCPDKERSSIWSQIKGRDGIKLITLDHGPERSHDAAMQVLNCPPLSEKEIEHIVRSYVSTPNSLPRWAQMCEGSPRVAHAVGENLRSNPEDVLKPPATVPIWNRYIAGYRSLDSVEAKQAQMIMRHLALFLKFGFEAPVEAEAQHIASLVQKADPQITWPVFQEHVQRMREKRILQGKRTLVIVPRLLHLHLWREFWDAYGRGFDYDATLEAMPASLQHWFTTLFSYAHTHPVALSVVERLLARGGRIEVDALELLGSDPGARFFGSLTEAHPDAAIELLKGTVVNWSDAQLKEWKSGRQMVVWALERIAVWRHLFSSAVEVLVPMALNENADNSNNATGTLRGLFHIGPGWAATQAPPDQRFPLIQELLRSTSHAHRILGLSLCKAWLTTHGGIRMVGPEHQGLRPTIEFWRPKTYGEMYDAWRLVWRFLFAETRAWSEQDRAKAHGVLIESGGGLIHHRAMADEVLDTWQALAADSATNKESLIHTVIHKQRFPGKGTPRPVLRRLRELDVQMTGTSFWSRFERYVMFSPWEESYRPNTQDTSESALTKRVQKLVAELARSPKLLSSHLGCMVRAKGSRVSELGDLLARRVAKRSLTHKVIAAQSALLPAAEGQFFMGYICGLRSLSESEWERVISGLLRDPETLPIGHLAIRSSGLTSAILDRVTGMVARKEIDPTVLGGIACRRECRAFPAASIWNVMKALVAVGSKDALLVATELADQHYCSKEDPSSPLKFA